MTRLVGNRDILAFEVQPLAPSWETRYPAEKAGWAALAIWVEAVNLCEHVGEGTDQLQQAVNVPLGPLADWFVRSWAHVRFEERPRLFAGSEAPHDNLRLWGNAQPAPKLTEEPWLEARERWWSTHFVHAGAEGALIPNLAFARSHDMLVCQWSPERVVLPGTPRWVRGGGTRSVEWAAAEETIASFVAFVAEWLRNAGAKDLYSWCALADPIRQTRVDAALALELLAGHTTDDLCAAFGAQTADELRRSLGLANEDDPSASPVTQALRDLPPRLEPAISAPLAWLRDRTSARAQNEGCRAARASAADAARGVGTDVEAGYGAADAVRRELRLDGQPMLHPEEVLGRLGIECREFEGPAEAGQMVVGAREGLGAAAAVVRSDRTRADWARRFEWARALGHILLDSFRGGAMGAASSPYCLGHRRRRSGAFAAELLLPREALARITGGNLDAAAEPDVFGQIMRDYGTGATATANHLFNRGFLSSAAVRDDLIERHAARL